MRKWLSYLLVVAVAELALALPQGNQVPFSITISAAGNVYKAGSELRIRLLFKNISDHDIPYTRSLGTGVESQGETFTDVEVRDARGELMPETSYYRVLRGRASPKPTAPGKSETASATATATATGPEPRPRFRGSFTGSMLRPGEFREEDILVSKLYDFSQPGQYALSASRRLSDLDTDPNSRLVAKSNTLLITITK